MNITFSTNHQQFSGPGGSLPLHPDDEISRRMAMLVAGECGDMGVTKVAESFKFSRQRYYQLRSLYLAGGAAALAPHIPGPKTEYRRTDEVIRLAIRIRFLDPDATAAVVSQKLRQLGHTISTRSVERIIADYGLQKKTSHT